MTDYVLFDYTHSVHPDYSQEVIGVLSAENRKSAQIIAARLFPKRKIHTAAWLYTAKCDREKAMRQGRIIITGALA